MMKSRQILLLVVGVLEAVIVSFLLFSARSVQGFAASRPLCAARRITAVTRRIKARRQVPRQRVNTSSSSSSSSSSFSTEGPIGAKSITANNDDKDKTPSTAATATDSIVLYTQDVARVLYELRSTEDDPSIPRLFHRRSRSPTFTHPWTFADWEKHYTRWRFWNYVQDFPSSRILKRIAPQLSILVLWSVFVAWHATIMGSRSVGVQLLEMAALPLTPLSLVSTFVAALLTLRTNQCLSRLFEARVAMGNIVAYTRQMAQLVAVSVYTRHAQLGLLASRHVALYTWLLRSMLRGQDKVGDDRDLICTVLPPRGSGKTTSRGGEETKPCSPSAAYILGHRKQPMAVLSVLRQIMVSLRDQLTVSEAEALEHTIQELNMGTLTLERILASPIPPLYSAHTGRLLMFNLVFLPLALQGSLPRVATIIATLAVGFAMLGLDEISHLLENPFRLMPLWYLAKNAMKDCADALVCQPPELLSTLDSDESAIVAAPLSPPYW